MDQLTKSEAKKMLNVDLAPGEYEIGFKYEGGVYNIQLGTFLMEPLGESQPRKIKVIDDPINEVAFAHSDSPAVRVEKVMLLFNAGLIDVTKAMELLAFNNMNVLTGR